MAAASPPNPAVCDKSRKPAMKGNCARAIRAACAETVDQRAGGQHRDDHAACIQRQDRDELHMGQTFGRGEMDLMEKHCGHETGRGQNERHQAPDKRVAQCLAPAPVAVAHQPRGLAGIIAACGAALPPQQTTHPQQRGQCHGRRQPPQQAPRSEAHQGYEKDRQQGLARWRTRWQQWTAPCRGWRQTSGPCRWPRDGCTCPARTAATQGSQSAAPEPR